MNLWDLNPLVLAYQANSFTISRLQLRVFQDQSGRIWTDVYLVPSEVGNQAPQQTVNLQINKTRLAFND